MFYPSSRWWLIRNVGKLLASGTMPVEFTDFWLGDQFCSLVFTLSNIFFIGCAYVDGWGSSWNECSSRRHWGAPFALASLPLVVRAVQSVKRYSDSHLNTHLINGGKYLTGVIYYAVYFAWRHSGNPHNWLMALFCLAGTSYSIYAASWDMLMDWSLLKRPAQYPLLRRELVYTNHIPLYYFALITNLVIRFSWIIYIPSAGMDSTLRTFIAAILEMLRRCQWNFFRLENEHIGNTDQYRVTREVPLPYSFHDGDNISDDDGGEEEDENFSGTDSWRRRRPVRLPRLRNQDMDASHSS
ncbi:EXS-domain-containing protein [Rickenella mellea]|uniref:EXS-domain-containing protein n=1 Tax=Rickenella mellea TaxID=50990 RepID=A0A4Y7Q6J5_9AGAM|nr:EXS-domain-containing protein [Rickenella mellea]